MLSFFLQAVSLWHVLHCPVLKQDARLRHNVVPENIVGKVHIRCVFRPHHRPSTLIKAHHLTLHELQAAAARPLCMLLHLSGTEIMST